MGERECLQHLAQLEKWEVVTSELDIENVRTRHDLELLEQVFKVRHTH